MLSSAHHFPTAFLFCLGLSFAAPAQQQTQAPLDNQRIIQLTQSGVHSDELQRIIASAPEVNFLLNPASTDVMLKAGVSEDVIKAMAAREVNSVSRERARQADAVATSEAGNIDSVHARPEPKKEKHKQPKAKATPSRNILNIDTTGFTPLNARIIQQAQERYRNEELLKQMQEDLQEPSRNALTWITWRPSPLRKLIEARLNKYTQQRF